MSERLLHSLWGHYSDWHFVLWRLEKLVQLNSSTRLRGSNFDLLCARRRSLNNIISIISFLPALLPPRSCWSRNFAACVYSRVHERSRGANAHTQVRGGNGEWCTRNNRCRKIGFVNVKGAPKVVLLFISKQRTCILLTRGFIFPACMPLSFVGVWLRSPIGQIISRRVDANANTRLLRGWLESDFGTRKENRAPNLKTLWEKGFFSCLWCSLRFFSKYTRKIYSYILYKGDSTFDLVSGKFLWNNCIPTRFLGCPDLSLAYKCEQLWWNKELFACYDRVSRLF